MLDHDFKRFPELTFNQMQIFYFMSPHKQIMEDFIAEVVKVHDGDTIRVKADFRDFDFPVRLADIDAPDKGQEGWKASHDWLANRVLGQEVEIRINKFNRVDKWGRLLGRIFHNGTDVNEDEVRAGLAEWWQG